MLRIVDVENTIEKQICEDRKKHMNDCKCFKHNDIATYFFQPSAMFLLTKCDVRANRVRRSVSSRVRRSFQSGAMLFHLSAIDSSNRMRFVLSIGLGWKLPIMNPTAKAGGL
jgi:hypothetical protein